MILTGTDMGYALTAAWPAVVDSMETTAILVSHQLIQELVRCAMALMIIAMDRLMRVLMRKNVLSYAWLMALIIIVRPEWEISGAAETITILLKATRTIQPKMTPLIRTVVATAGIIIATGLSICSIQAAAPPARAERRIIHGNREAAVTSAITILFHR